MSHRALHLRHERLDRRRAIGQERPAGARETQAPAHVVELALEAAVAPAEALGHDSGCGAQRRLARMAGGAQIRPAEHPASASVIAIS